MLLPPGFADQLQSRELEMVLTHELAHVLRGDNWLLLLQRLNSVLWWFNPIAHAFNRRLTRAREEVCDNYVLSNSDGVSYGEMLLRLARQASMSAGQPMAIGYWDKKWSLESRIAGILHNRRKTMTRVSTVSMTIVATLAFALIAVVAGTGVDAQTRNRASKKMETDRPYPSSRKVQSGNNNASGAIGNGYSRRPRAAGSQLTQGNTQSNSAMTNMRSSAIATTFEPAPARLQGSVDQLRQVQRNIQATVPHLKGNQRILGEELNAGIGQLLSKVARFKRKKRLAELAAQMKVLKVEIERLRQKDRQEGGATGAKDPGSREDIGSGEYKDAPEPTSGNRAGGDTTGTGTPPVTDGSLKPKKRNRR